MEFFRFAICDPTINLHNRLWNRLRNTQEVQILTTHVQRGTVYNPNSSIPTTSKCTLGRTSIFNNCWNVKSYLWFGRRNLASESLDNWELFCPSDWWGIILLHMEDEFWLTINKAHYRVWNLPAAEQHQCQDIFMLFSFTLKAKSCRHDEPV